MTHKYPLAFLQAAARRHPSGQEAELLAHGKTDGTIVEVGEFTHAEILKKFPMRSPGRYSLNLLRVTAHLRPVGYVEFTLARGKIDGDQVTLDEAASKELREKFPPRPQRSLPSTPTLAELTTNFSGALATWAKAGFKVIDREAYERRHAICLACEFWQPDARLGFGKCRRCGCSRFKLWLATSRCPDKPPRW